MIIFLTCLCLLAGTSYSQTHLELSNSECDGKLNVFTVSFDEDTLSNVVEDDRREIVIHMNVSEQFRPSTYDGSWILNVTVRSSSEKNLEIYSNKTFEVVVKNDTFDFVFTVKGVFIGFSTINVEMSSAFKDEVRDMCWCESIERTIGVVRPNQEWMVVFTVFMAFMVALNYINMGVQLDLGVVKETLRRPIGPAIGFVSQFTVMPLAAYAYGYLILSDTPLMRLGLFALGCSPGGSSSNFWTLMFKGDINLSITMTFVSIICALGMMPLWIYTLGKQLTVGGSLQIPYGNLAMSLGTTTAPLFIGIVIKYKFPRVAAFSRKIIRPMTIVVVLVAMTVGTATNYYIYLLFTWKIALAGFAVAFTGYCLGGLLAWIARLKGTQIVAVSIETAFQNAGVTMVVLASALESPNRELVLIPVIMQILVTQLPLWFVFIGIKIRNKCFSNAEIAIAENDKESQGTEMTEKDGHCGLEVGGTTGNISFVTK